MKRSKRLTLQYLSRVGIALSVLTNVILGGQSNQTFSARNWIWKKQGKPNLVWLIDRLAWTDPDHCLHSYLYWYTRKNIRNAGKRYLQMNKKDVQYVVIKDNMETYNENIN